MPRTKSDTMPTRTEGDPMRRLTDGEREVLAELEWDARDWALLEGDVNGDVEDAETVLDTCPPPPMPEGPTTDPFDPVTPPF